MRALRRLLLLGLILAGIVMALRSRGTDLVRRLTHASSAGAEDDTPAQRTVYKWKDEGGTWHYSNRPPNDGRSARRVTVHVPYVEGRAEPEPSSGGVGVREMVEATRALPENARIHQEATNAALREAGAQ